MNAVFNQKFDGKNCYFSSDLHLNHKNLCFPTSSWPDKDKSTRKFLSLDEMNEVIIDSINIEVPENGIFFILGDILFGYKGKLPYWVDRINCKEIHYIMGNHCDFIRNSIEYQNLFTSCQDYLEIFCSGKTGKYTKCCLFHYPIKVWRDNGKFSYALTGHSHGSLPYTDTELGLDVGWDVWHRPLNFLEIEEILSKRTFQAKDHHSIKTNYH